MPDALPGLLITAVLVLPGYIWVRVAEVRGPRAERSGLTEAAELLLVGLVSSGLAATLVVAVGPLSVEPLLTEGRTYWTANLNAALGSAAATLLLSYGGVWVAAHAWARRRSAPGSIVPGTTPWYQVLVSNAGQDDVALQVTMTDGSTYVGRMIGFTTDAEPGTPDIALGVRPRLRRGAGTDLVELQAKALLLPGDQIREVSVSYIPRTRPARRRGPVAATRRGLRRLRRRGLQLGQRSDR